MPTLDSEKLVQVEAAAKVMDIVQCQESTILGRRVAEQAGKAEGHLFRRFSARKYQQLVLAICLAHTFILCKMIVFFFFRDHCFLSLSDYCKVRALPLIDSLSHC
jgi:hypothetical protein